ncbi:hypothetical protein PGB90_009029 [Kerria lacca]
MSMQIFLRASCCGNVRILSTSFAHIFRMLKFSCKICRTHSLSIPIDSAIVGIFNRRSDRTRLSTFSIFSSVFDVEGRPERESSSTFSRPS